MKGGADSPEYPGSRYPVETGEGTTAADRNRLRVRIVSATCADEPFYEELMADILELQHLVAWRTDMTAPEQARGFLATTWSLQELHALMDEGAYVAVAVDQVTRQLQGYSLMAPIRHLPPGDFAATADSPIRTRTELLDGNRFVYGYQLAVRPDRTLRNLPVGIVVLEAIAAENVRRGMNAVSCVMEAPACNKLSMAFVSAMGIQRVGTIHDPRGTSLIGGQVTWACMVRLPLMTPGTIQGGLRNGPL